MLVFSIVLILVLLTFTAFISAAESAFFSLEPADIEKIKSSTESIDKKLVSILDKPKLLLATLLVSVNFINIAIVIISTIVANSYIDNSSNPFLSFIIQVVVITFIILLIGEVIPKIYATQNPLKTAKFMTYPVVFLEKLFYPISWLLVLSTSIIDKRIKSKGHKISVSELSHALDLTTSSEITREDQKILKGIVKFGNIDVKQIMRPRVDLSAFESNIGFSALIEKINHSGFSRIPIYKENIDKILGILYVKDVLPHIEKKDFEWQQLLRKPFYVPENKKLDDLLKDFQHQKIHLAIVVDEYGGTSGVVTLEDVLEEIVGEINDEFDDDEIIYSKLDSNNYVFEGKILLNDLYRILEIDGKDFEELKGESDTLAGFLIELKGNIPLKGDKIEYKNLLFTIESSDNRKIKRVKTTIQRVKSKT